MAKTTRRIKKSDLVRLVSLETQYYSADVERVMDAIEKILYRELATANEDESVTISYNTLSAKAEYEPPAICFSPSEGMCKILDGGVAITAQFSETARKNFKKSHPCAEGRMRTPDLLTELEIANRKYAKRSRRDPKPIKEEESGPVETND